MNIIDIIEKKKRKLELTQEEIELFVGMITDNSLDDGAASAMLMAICINGMTPDETYHLTIAMCNSGEIVDLSEVSGVIVDKHSSGGVSDSTTLIITAILASLGVKVAKMSGRGLGHTGGTIDKLECFTGYNVDLTRDEFLRAVQDVSACITGQSGNLVPADKRLYALRDVTGTIDSLPLIASSIMSKKLASGVQNILLDVKYSNGAFIKDARMATELARLMTDIGNRAGRNVKAFVTAMNEPLGDNIGCSLEMREVLDVLSGKQNKLYDLSVQIAKELLVMSGAAESYETAETMIAETMGSNSARLKLREIIGYNGGDITAFDDISALTLAKYTADIIAEEDGIVTELNALKLGQIVHDMGGGRSKKGESIDHTVGISLLKKIGDEVLIGDVLMTIYASSMQSLANAIDKAKTAFRLNGEREYCPLIFSMVSSDGVVYDDEAYKKIQLEDWVMEFNDKINLEAEEFKYRQVIKSLEHTLLSQTATPQMIKKLCDEAHANNFAAVCIHPTQIMSACKALGESDVKVCTVVGFPYGEETTRIKVAQTRQAVSLGADEIDMVMSISKAKQGDWKFVRKEITKVVNAARKRPVKVIIEASLLTESEIKHAVKAIVDGKAQFVKTSTGLFGAGATPENLKIISEQLKKLNAPGVGIKAAGGIKTMQDVFVAMNLGATRIGTSSAMDIADEVKGQMVIAKRQLEKLQAERAKEMPKSEEPVVAKAESESLAQQAEAAQDSAAVDLNSASSEEIIK